MIKGIKVEMCGPSWEGEVRATEEIREIEVRSWSGDEDGLERDGRRVSERRVGKS